MKHLNSHIREMEEQADKKEVSNAELNGLKRTVKELNVQLEILKKDVPEDDLKEKLIILETQNVDNLEALDSWKGRYEKVEQKIIQLETDNQELEGKISEGSMNSEGVSDFKYNQVERERKKLEKETIDQDK